MPVGQCKFSADIFKRYIIILSFAIYDIYLTTDTLYYFPLYNLYASGFKRYLFLMESSI